MMKSPFPGMDPYLECHLGDMHTRIALYACDQLKRQLPRDLVARVEEHVGLEVDEEDNSEYHGYYPDVRVEEFPNGHSNTAAETSSTALVDRIRITRKMEPLTQRSVRIIAPATGNRIVTTIEIISPGNKIGVLSRKAYQEKRDELLKAKVSVVEIDLIRAGRPILPVPLSMVPVKYRGPYRVCVIRSWKTGEAELYRLSLRLPLPVVQIPLRKKDAEVALDLQSLISQAYENGSYDRTDYRKEPEPPLAKEDADWADQLLREKELR